MTTRSESLRDLAAAAAAPLPPDQADRAELLRRVEAALTHYGIGQAAAANYLPVAWAYVAAEMAKALAGRDGDAR